MRDFYLQGESQNSSPPQQHILLSVCLCNHRGSTDTETEEREREREREFEVKAEKKNESVRGEGDEGM